MHWFNLLEKNSEWRIDLDLHLNSYNIDIGWQNDFMDKNYINTKNQKIIFSVDMTDAPIKSGGATEAFFISESLEGEILMVNLNYFNRYENKSVPFKLILANVDKAKIDRQYLIDSHEVAFCVPNEINSGEIFLGFVTSNEDGDKKFYFHSGNMGDRRVAKSTELTEKTISAMSTTFESCLSLNEILEKADAIFEDVDASNCDINLDPAEVTKDILIDLFAKKQRGNYFNCHTTAQADFFYFIGLIRFLKILFLFRNYGR